MVCTSKIILVKILKMKRSDDDKIQFLNELPLNLKIELSVIMHKDLVKGVDFFKVL